MTGTQSRESPLGKFDIAGFNLHIKFPMFSGPVFACVAMVSYDRRCMFPLVGALKLSGCLLTALELALIFPIKTLYVLPSLPSFSHSELFVIVSSWKRVCLGIQSVLLPLLAEKVSPFPLNFVCTSPLSSLLWHFQPHAL